MAQEVEVTRSLLPSPTPENPERRVYQVRYKPAGMLPGFIYIEEKDWSLEEETARIKAHIQKRLESKPEKRTI